VADFCEHDNEPKGSIKDGEFLEGLIAAQEGLYSLEVSSKFRKNIRKEAGKIIVPRSCQNIHFTCKLSGDFNACIRGLLVSLVPKSEV
jgi:hypothetical protein